MNEWHLVKAKTIDCMIHYLCTVKRKYVAIFTDIFIT